MSKDWRLQGQEKYLKGKELTFKQWSQTRDNWDHDHCKFCSKTITDNRVEGDYIIHEGYTTENDYHWVCEGCFEDFKELFQWKVR